MRETRLPQIDDVIWFSQDGSLSGTSLKPTPKSWIQGATEIARSLMNTSRSPCPAGPVAQPHQIIQCENMQTDLPDIPAVCLTLARKTLRISQDSLKMFLGEFSRAGVSHSPASSGRGTEGKGRCVQRGRGRAPTTTSLQTWLTLAPSSPSKGSGLRLYEQGNVQHRPCPHPQLPLIASLPFSPWALPAKGTSWLPQSRQEPARALDNSLRGDSLLVCFELLVPPNVLLC